MTWNSLKNPSSSEDPLKFLYSHLLFAHATGTGGWTRYIRFPETAAPWYLIKPLANTIIAFWSWHDDMTIWHRIYYSNYPDIFFCACFPRCSRRSRSQYLYSDFNRFIHQLYHYQARIAWSKHQAPSTKNQEPRTTIHDSRTITTDHQSRTAYELWFLVCLVGPCPLFVIGWVVVYPIYWTLVALLLDRPFFLVDLLMFVAQAVFALWICSILTSFLFLSFFSCFLILSDSLFLILSACRFLGWSALFLSISILE